MVFIPSQPASFQRNRFNASREFAFSKAREKDNTLLGNEVVASKKKGNKSEVQELLAGLSDADLEKNLKANSSFAGEFGTFGSLRFRAFQSEVKRRKSPEFQVEQQIKQLESIITDQQNRERQAESEATNIDRRNQSRFIQQAILGRSRKKKGRSSTILTRGVDTDAEDSAKSLLGG